VGDDIEVEVGDFVTEIKNLNPDQDKNEKILYSEIIQS
jgi:hypothetical protein